MPRRTELFLVEGDSAGGSAKQGRDKEFQAVLPLRGKVLNTWEVEKDRLFANNEIHDIAVAIGVDPHAPTDTVDLSGLRYNAILIMADADVDGSHISTLLLTLFYRHFYRVVEAGKIYIAQPPLFRIDVPAHGKKQASKIYALNEAETDGHPGQIAQGKSARRQLVDLALQRSGRNESRATVGYDAESGYQTCTVREGGSGFVQGDDGDIQHADGQAGSFDPQGMAGVSRE